MNHDEHPLYATREEALAATGEIYEHYKGGIYRIHMRGVRDSEQHEAFLFSPVSCILVTKASSSIG